MARSGGHLMKSWYMNKFETFFFPPLPSAMSPETINVGNMTLSATRNLRTQAVTKDVVWMKVAFRDARLLGFSTMGKGGEWERLYELPPEICRHI